MMFLPAIQAENRGVSIPIFYCEIKDKFINIMPLIILGLHYVDT